MKPWKLGEPPRCNCYTCEVRRLQNEQSRWLQIVVYQGEIPNRLKGVRVNSEGDAI